MKNIALYLIPTLFLCGCPLTTMEQVTKDTRDEVKATREGTQTLSSLEICLDKEISISSRTAACKPALLRLPEDRLADHLGLPLRILKETSVKRSLVGGEVDIPNVVYVGTEHDIDTLLQLSPMSEDQHSVFQMAVLQAVSDISLKAMQAGGIPEGETQTYRDYGLRLIYAGTAILGAIPLNELSQIVKRASIAFEAKEMIGFQFISQINDRALTISKILPEDRRTKAVDAMRTLGKNLSLAEDELRTLDRLAEIRMGVRSTIDP